MYTACVILTSRIFPSKVGVVSLYPFHEQTKSVVCHIYSKLILTHDIFVVFCHFEMLWNDNLNISVGNQGNVHDAYALRTDSL